MSKPSIERLRELIDQARKAHDEPTVKALGEKLFEATGVYEPEFAPVESSGDPKLDHLKACLVQAIAARDEPTEVLLREKIKEIEGEPLPEVTVELTKEECVEVVEEDIENPFNIPEEETISLEELEAELEEESLEPEEEETSIGQVFKDVLGATQLAALRKAELFTDLDIKKRIFAMDDDAMGMLVQISGIGVSSAKTIMETLGYEA